MARGCSEGVSLEHGGGPEPHAPPIRCPSQVARLEKRSPHSPRPLPNTLGARIPSGWCWSHAHVLTQLSTSNRHALLFQPCVMTRPRMFPEPGFGDSAPAFQAERVYNFLEAGWEALSAPKIKASHQYRPSCEPRCTCRAWRRGFSRPCGPQGTLKLTCSVELQPPRGSASGFLTATRCPCFTALTHSAF